ncbi:endolytic transglycosylase MltG [Capnocytophaga canimorsus]|uniref:endolytic transglycosylase MltG n=1 Tax=Capnocytophaga canimorsus TaxID=28188 RepID=UPI0037D52790
MYIRRILTITALIGLVFMGVFVYYVYSAVFAPNTAFQNKEAIVLVRTNATFKDVIEQLEPLLENTDSFIKIAQKKGYIQNIKAGRFIIKKGSSNNEIVNVLRSKNTPIKLAFNNQETLSDLAKRIAEQIEADSLSLIQAFTDIHFLKENDFTISDAIGMYVPNTYEFFWNTSAEKFRDRMLKEYQRFWNETRIEKAKKQSLTPKQATVLASIVQKETAQVSERKRVAGVYLNRLKMNMLLQADPTVIFAIKEHTGNYDTIIKRVLYKDLEINSPYNTYKYPGLPPAPIAMPDISSIEAVLDPEKHDFLFFVADPENFGFHKFARTLAQHNKNKEVYVKWIQSQGIKR